jgi:hypothetical protein
MPAALQDKIQMGLDENRLLVLGCQVLLGLQFRFVFEKNFDRLPKTSQYTHLIGMCAMVLAFSFLITPSTFHRIAEKGEDTERVSRVLSALMWPALFPFLVGFSTDFYVVGAKLGGNGLGLALAGATFAIGLLLLYVIEAIRRFRRASRTQRMEKMAEVKQKPTSLDVKIRHVLTEARLVVPGAQALLGFQFTAFLAESFEKLPSSSQWIHLASVCCVTLSVILLMAPAAYHRVAEGGENTPQLLKFAHLTILLATIPLALGISGDLFVVLQKVTGSAPIGAVGAIGSLVISYGLWFGISLAARVGGQSAHLSDARSRA